jgi:hypothetical protein
MSAARLQKPRERDKTCWKSYHMLHVEKMIRRKGERLIHFMETSQRCSNFLSAGAFFDVKCPPFSTS